MWAAGDFTLVPQSERHTEFQRHIESGELIRTLCLKACEIVNGVFRFAQSSGNTINAWVRFSFRFARATRRKSKGGHGQNRSMEEWSETVIEGAVNEYRSFIA